MSDGERKKEGKTDILIYTKNTDASISGFSGLGNSSDAVDWVNGNDGEVSGRRGSGSARYRGYGDIPRVVGRIGSEFGAGIRPNPDGPVATIRPIGIHDERCAQQSGPLRKNRDGLGKTLGRANSHGLVCSVSNGEGLDLPRNIVAFGPHTLVKSQLDNPPHGERVDACQRNGGFQLFGTGRQFRAPHDVGEGDDGEGGKNADDRNDNQ